MVKHFEICQEFSYRVGRSIKILLSLLHSTLKNVDVFPFYKTMAYQGFLFFYKKNSEFLAYTFPNEAC